MKVLITGGAGYIGSQIAWKLHDHGHLPVIIDDLSTGLHQLIAPFPFFFGNVEDFSAVEEVFTKHPDIESVIHCAAKTVVSDSIRYPLEYYGCNVASGISMLNFLSKFNIESIIFSSSASVYGATDETCVNENSEVRPNSPYSRAKYIFEQILGDFASTHSIKALCLRYFNPVGADIQLRCGSPNPTPTHLLGSLLSCSAERKVFCLYGTDWNTRDGTALRDYIDVVDLAEAHVLALQRMAFLPKSVLLNRHGLPVINIGTACGTTVREFVEAYRATVDRELRVLAHNARPGDIRGSFADNSKARHLLGWQPKSTLHDSIRHAYAWSKSRQDARFYRPSDYAAAHP